MTYSISIYRFNEGLVHEVSDIPTRADLAEILDSLLKRFPKPLHEFNVTGTVCTRYTLVDSDVTTGDETIVKLWDFMQGGK